MKQGSRVCMAFALLLSGCAALDDSGAVRLPEVSIEQAVEMERRHLESLPETQRWPARYQSPPIPLQGLAPGLATLPPSSLAIDLVRPVNESEPLKVPASLQFRFSPSAGARIDPSSFRALYGLMKIDITRQIARGGVLGEAGVETDASPFASGLHRIYLQISDSRGAKVEREFRFNIAR